MLLSAQPDYRELYISMIEAFDALRLSYFILEILYDENSKPVDGILREVSHATEKLIGKTREQLVSKTTKELFKNLKDEYPEKFDKVLKTGEPSHLEIYGPALQRYYDAYAWKINDHQVAAIATDITDRKKAQEALKESEDLYRTLFENTYDGFVLLEPVYEKSGAATDFRFLKVNRAYESLTGREAADVEGRMAREVAIDPESKWISTVGEVVRTGKPSHYEYHAERTNNWYDAYCFPYTKGKVGIFFEDITGRKRVEDALSESEQKYKELVTRLPEMIVEINEKGRVTFANSRVIELLGYSKAELYDDFDANRFVAEEDVARSRDNMKLTFAGGMRKSNEYMFVKKDGTRFPVLLTSSPIVKDNKIVGARGIVIDITERKQAEAALKSSEEKYRIYVENSPVAFFAINSERKYVQVNKAACNLLGYSQKELLKMTVFDVTFKDDILVGDKLYYELQETGKAAGELRLKRKDGQPVYVILNSTKLPNGRAMAFCENITERKKLEKRLQENERLATIGATAGMVGHDIRNPLQSMIGDVYLLKSDLRKMPEDEIKNSLMESFDNIEKNILYINKIVDDLQDYARKLNPEFKEIALPDLLAKIFEAVQVPDSITLLLDVKGLPKIRVDPEFLRRGLTNLITNAIQAMPNGGSLEVAGFEKDGKAFLTVSDNGVGIPEDIKPKLFTPMMTTKAKGQGFGLAVVKRLVEALNGSITFESTEGKGTKFMIELPLVGKAGIP